MPEDLRDSPGGPQAAAAGVAPAPSFQEFLYSKAAALGVRDRHRRRDEWLGAVRRLLDQLRDWLRASDPEGLLDIETYEIARAESALGSYEAPAMKIHLGAIEVEVKPMGRWVPNFSARGPFAGRVDLSDGMRKYSLFREIRDGEDHWLVPDRDGQDRFTELDRDGFERILQDLLS